MGFQMNPMQLIGMLKNSGNPQQMIITMLEQCAQGNPVMENLINLAKNNDTKSIEISLENKDIDNSFIPTLSTAHKFSDSVIESDAISHCLEDFCKKI